MKRQNVKFEKCKKIKHMKVKIQRFKQNFRLPIITKSFILCKNMKLCLGYPINRYNSKLLAMSFQLRTEKQIITIFIFPLTAAK